jgi:anti-sigma factor RsiW
MNAESREELLSAYLDDEVTEPERRQVEAWLAEDAGYRQLHEELRALRGRLQALPRHKLERDLSDVVLRRAERAVLAGEQTPKRVAEPATVAARYLWSGRSWRMMAWPAIAVAAAVLIAIFNRQPTGEREVAQQMPASKMAAPRQSSAEARNAAQPELGIRSESETDSAAGRAVAPASPLPSSRDDVAAESAPAGGRAMLAKPAAEGANVRDLKAMKGDQAYEKKKELGPAPIVCYVSSDFLESNKFEKLLTDKKIAWQTPKADQSDDKPAERAAKDIAVVRQFVVQATPDELSAILDTLRSQPTSVVKIESEELSRDRLLKSRLASPSDADERKSDADAKRPVIFQLRLLGDSERGNDPPR